MTGYLRCTKALIPRSRSKYGWLGSMALDVVQPRWGKPLWYISTSPDREGRGEQLWTLKGQSADMLALTEHMDGTRVEVSGDYTPNPSYERANVGHKLGTLRRVRIRVLGVRDEQA